MGKSFKCKFCGSTFDEENRFLNHKKVHGRKSKVFKPDSFGDSEHALGSGLVNQ
jgi:hypothetical protein